MSEHEVCIEERWKLEATLNSRIQELEEDLPLAAEAFRKLREIRALCDKEPWSLFRSDLYDILDSGEHLT